jgi:hypothetical protein
VINIGSLANPSALNGSFYDQTFKGFHSELHSAPEQIGKARFLAMDPKAIKDENGAAVSKKGFFSSWMSNAKKLATMKK